MSEEWSSISENSTNGRLIRRKVAPVRWAFRLLSPLVPTLVGRLAFLIFRATQRFAVPRREQSWLTDAEAVELELDGGKIGGWVWGEGPTVLLMHGWTGRASQMGALAVALARAGYRAVALDAPGHGTSAGRLSSLPQFADTVRLAVDSFGPLEAVVAHSFGAAGTGWALRQRLAVDRLVFIAAPGDLRGYFRAFRELFGMTERSLAAMLTVLERRFSVDWQEVRFATTIAADERPLLVVHDERDDETHYSGALEIRAAWRSSQLVTTRGLGHRRILRDEGVLAEVVAFVGGGRLAGAAACDRGETAREMATAS